MAKGNLFQGMARGKVGDVVFYRMNGQQMSRVRNRAPKNPRTNEQLYQRAIISTVMKAYSAGKSIFDHAFQGYTIGEGCMRRFNSLNARLLRAMVATEINSEIPVEQETSRVVAPRATSCTPVIGLQISEGTLEQTLITFGKKDGVSGIYNVLQFVAALENETAVNYLLRLGIHADDIFTIVAFDIDIDNPVYTPYWTNSVYATQYNTNFGWLRLRIKDGISEELLASNATFNDLFSVEYRSNLNEIDMTKKITPGQDNYTLMEALKENTATVGVIRSRLDVDLRSTSYMVAIKKNYGLTASNLIYAWADDVQKIGESELILEGGEDQGVKPGGYEVPDRINPLDVPVNESPVPTMARHKGTRNNKR